MMKSKNEKAFGQSALRKSILHNFNSLNNLKNKYDNNNNNNCNKKRFSTRRFTSLLKPDYIKKIECDYSKI